MGSSGLSASSSHSACTNSFASSHSHSRRAALLSILGISRPRSDGGLLKEVLDTLGSHLGGLYLGGGEEDDGAEDDEGELEDLGASEH